MIDCYSVVDVGWHFYQWIVSSFKKKSQPKSYLPKIPLNYLLGQVIGKFLNTYLAYFANNFGGNMRYLVQLWAWL